MWKLTVEANPHNQIAVALGSESRVGECYYLGLTDSATGTEPGAETVRAGLRQLLSGWLVLLQRLSDGQQVFLPFDFSDEYTRWISVRRSGADAEVVFGWAAVEGWAISLQDFSELSCSLTGFCPDEPLVSQQVYLPRLIQQVRCAVLGLGSGLGMGAVSC